MKSRRYGKKKSGRATMKKQRREKQNKKNKSRNSKKGGGLSGIFSAGKTAIVPYLFYKLQKSLKQKKK